MELLMAGGRLDDGSLLPSETHRIGKNELRLVLALFAVERGGPALSRPIRCFWRRRHDRRLLFLLVPPILHCLVTSATRRVDAECVSRLRPDDAVDVSHFDAVEITKRLFA